MKRQTSLLNSVFLYTFDPAEEPENGMRLLTWLKHSLEKKDYDFDRPDITLYNFHPQILKVLAIVGIFSGKKDSLIRLIWPFISISLTLVGIGLESLFIFHGVTTKDFSFAIECFCYLVMLGSIPCVYLGILRNRDEILSMLRDINEDFNHVCGLGTMYREPFMESQLLIWKLCVGWFGFTGLIGVLFASFPVVLLVYQTLFATVDEHMIRPLAFPMWLPYDDPYRTPNYEIFLIMQINFSTIFVQGFCGYVYLLFHFLHHYNIMMDMIILDVQNIFDGLDTTVISLPKEHPRRVEVQKILKKRIGRIVTWHLSVFKALTSISSVFGPPLVYQVMFSSMAICLVGLQVASDLDDGKFNALFVLLLIGGFMQLYVPCYLGTSLRNKGYAIGDACFTCGWHETPLGRLVSTDLAIIMFRSQIPIYIKFTGLPNIQLETFSSISSTAYSYFNMLRQYSS